MSVAARAAGEPAQRFALTDGLFAAAVFSGAGLVFLVEPLIGKLLLPLLGGSPAVWNTTLAFFQAALLVGYAYAHLLQRIGSIRRQAAIHLCVLALAALALPLRVSQAFGAPSTGAPALWLLGVLSLTVGPPFAALSATAPLLQAWFARTGESRGDPYRLYVASNLGSVLALAAYPTLIEPALGLKAQAQVWSLAYAVFCLLLAGAALRAWRSAPPAGAHPAVAPAEGTASPWRDRLPWLLLAAAPSSLLLGVTACITAEVASAPFLWVLPLELYLIAFIVAFARGAERPPSWLLGLQMIATPAALVSLSSPYSPWPGQLLVHLAAFFLAALGCCLALAARRPEPRRLTEFYLWISIGGVVGGAFNAFLAPVLFDRVWEYPAVLILALLAWPEPRERLTIEEIGRLVVGLACPALLLIPVFRPPDFIRWALLLTPAVMAVLMQRRLRLAAMLLTMLTFVGQVEGFGDYREHFRSFFGVVRLGEGRAQPLGPVRVMVHGVTLHGVQALAPRLRCTATSYYAPDTVIGSVIRREQAGKPAMTMAVVGLGAGTVATFVRAADRMRFFEIDPLMARLALDRRRFTFLRDCARGPVDIVLGDARLSLRRERPHSYDLILVDGFSSDSIPTHLLTVEAVRAYFSLLKPDGVLLLHLSNRNLLLEGPAAAAAKAAGGHALYGEHWVYGSTSAYVDASGAALLAARTAATLARYHDDPQYRPAHPDARPWTDDHTNVWGALMARIARGEDG